MIFGVNTTCDISKLSQISLVYRLVKLRVTVLKYHSRYLYQIHVSITTNHAITYTNIRLLILLLDLVFDIWNNIKVSVIVNLQSWTIVLGQNNFHSWDFL